MFAHETQQAFLEAHVDAFAFLDGVPAVVRYDNLGSAVKQILKGRRRVETDRFIALRSHYLFESAFTIAGVRGAHEKGGIENEVGRFRRRHLVPVPNVRTLAELNARLRAGCEQDLARRIAGHSETVGEAFARERPLLRALPDEPAQTAEEATPRVDNKALITVRQNRYSVPVALAGRRVRARIGAREITVFCDGREVARHDRLVGRFGVSAQLDHYLELIARKPGALAGSWRCTSSVSAASGPVALTSCGPGSASAMAPRRPPGRWSTCCSCAASTGPRGSSWPSAARWRPARMTAAPSGCSPAAANGRHRPRSTVCPTTWKRSSGRSQPSGTMTGC